MAAPVTGDIPRLDDRRLQDSRQRRLDNARRLPRCRVLFSRGVVPSAVQTNEQPCSQITLIGALFPAGSAELDDIGAGTLDDVAAALATRPGCLIVTGHTDVRPSSYPGGNDRLSLDRGRETVVDELVARHVDAGRSPRDQGRRLDGPGRYGGNRRRLREKPARRDLRACT